jgi:transposase
MDNLSAHKGDRVRKLIDERDCELVYLPPYSPDLNLLEEAFSKMKGILRKVGARGREALIERWARRSMLSPLEMRKASSSTVEAAHWVSYCGRRSTKGSPSERKANS